MMRLVAKKLSILAANLKKATGQDIILKKTVLKREEGVILSAIQAEIQKEGFSPNVSRREIAALKNEKHIERLIAAQQLVQTRHYAEKLRQDAIDLNNGKKTSHGGR